MSDTNSKNSKEEDKERVNQIDTSSNRLDQGAQDKDDD